jgi:hypothetical protein
LGASLTNAWQGTKSSYGTGNQSSVGGGLAMTGLTALLNTITGNPLLGTLIASAGTEIMGGLFGNKQSPYERNVAGLITNLQKQAAGMPTPATKMQGNYLNREVNRTMQSTAASATRAMPSGSQVGQTAPARVAQNRLQGARIEGMANIMGQSSINAQNQLAQAYGMQGELEAREAQSKSNVTSMVARLIGSFAKPQLSTDPFIRTLQENMIEGIKFMNQINKDLWGGKYAPTASSVTPSNTGNKIVNTNTENPVWNPTGSTNRNETLPATQSGFGRTNPRW